MNANHYDIIVIGAGSGGLSIGLFMNKAGFRVLMFSKSDEAIGGDCLNDGCVPSKALIHVSGIAHSARLAKQFGLEVTGKVDIKKAISYVYSKQEVIRKHENAKWLKEQGIDIVLGEAVFSGKNEVSANGNTYHGKKIVIATGSSPEKLTIPGVDMISYYDNKSIFYLQELPERLLVIGGGPIGIEMAQTFNRLGSRVTVVHKGGMILNHDDQSVAEILIKQLQLEGVAFHLNAHAESFISPNDCIINNANGDKKTIQFDGVFVGIGRALDLEPLQLQRAGIEVTGNKIKTDKYLRTTNKNVYVCGDIAGDLQFSHAAEFHARILLNNFFSPFKKKLDNRYMSWVTFTDPELASFGLNENQLIKRKIRFRKIEQDFNSDDRAVTDNYQYAKMILYISAPRWFKKQVILGGTMIAPHAGELIQELILANTNRYSVKALFNKVYPYPVASRINQQLIFKLQEEALTGTIKILLQKAYKIFS